MVRTMRIILGILTSAAVCVLVMLLIGSFSGESTSSSVLQGLSLGLPVGVVVALMSRRGKNPPADERGEQVT